MVVKSGEKKPPGLDLFTLGEPMILLLAEPGVPIRRAPRYRQFVAGAESNVAIGMARLGHAVGYLGRVGADAFGDVVAATLRAEAVSDCWLRQDASAPTGLLVRDALVDRSSEVLYFRSGSAGSRLAPADLPVDALGTASALFVTGVTAAISDTAYEAVRLAVDIAVDAGVPVVFDPNVRTRLLPADELRPRLATIAERADVVLASEEEAMFVSSEEDPEAAARVLLRHGAQLVVVKRGAAGSWATDGSRTASVGAEAILARDLVGAGDAFAAGFLSSWLEGGALEHALRAGGLVAAMCVGAAGDTDGLPTKAELERAAAGSVEVLR